MSPVEIALSNGKSAMLPVNPKMSVPNANVNPTMKNVMAPMTGVIRFFMHMLLAFLALCIPVSSMANPMFMKKTRNAAKRIHVVSIAFTGPYSAAETVPGMHITGRLMAAIFNSLYFILQPSFHYDILSKIIYKI